MSVFKHVLAATDFSEASAAATDLAIALAQDCGAGLTVLNVCEVPTFPEAIPPVDFVTTLSDVASTRLTGLLGEIRVRLPGAKGLVRVGSPWEEIVAAARDLGADLLVVGTHGRRGLTHALLGSVAERVVRTSPIPVLTVRSPGAR